MSDGSRLWLQLTAMFIVGALLGWWLPAAWLDWQPGLASTEHWRAWTAAFVHWSPLHLGTNLVAAAAVAAYGASAQLSRGAAWAWFAAWPLTHLGLLLKPDLAHYGGLSGLLHGGVAIVCLWLLMARPSATAAPTARRLSRAATSSHRQMMATPPCSTPERPP